MSLTTCTTDNMAVIAAAADHLGDAIDRALLGTITRNPVGIGQCVVDRLSKALKRETRPKAIDTGFCRCDKTNMADAKIASVLYD